MFGINALFGERDFLARLVSVIAGLATFAAAATKWIQAQTNWVRDLRGRIEPVAREIDEAVDAGIEQGLSGQRRAVADKLAELDSLRAQQAQAQKERDEAAAQSAALKNTLAAVGDDVLMRTFLDDRIGGGAYQQKLGIAALVRRDFERLSWTIREVSQREDGNQLTSGEMIINRIVLYIDDLDRCEMEKVVPVLRAVHLLLAFPAFVVVVGVDSRWVARCLEQHHPDIFASDDRTTASSVSPLDYLEKIFQIPIWLEPVSPDRRVSMVRELLRKPVRPQTGPAAGGLPQPVASDAMSSSPSESKLESKPGSRNDGVEEQRPGTGGPGEPVIAVATPLSKVPVVPEDGDGALLELNPSGLSITDGEYEFLGQMGGLLSASPRTIKRFVNTYRLLSVSLAQAGFQDSEMRPRDSEVRMLLLAVLVGMPDLSRWLQEVLRAPGGVNLALNSLVDVMQTQAQTALAGPSIAAHENAIAQWEIVREWIERRGGPWTTMPAARLSEWLDPVGRYTFNLRRSPASRSTSPTEVAQ